MDIVRPGLIRRGYLELVIRRLQQRETLSADDQTHLRALSGPRHIAGKGDRLTGDSDTLLLLDGWAGKVRDKPAGACPVFELAIPGDVLSHADILGDSSLYAFVALTSVVYLEMDSSTVADRPVLQAALAATRRDSHGRLLDQLTRLASQNAYDRVAHLLLELYARQAEIGLFNGARFSLPIGQVHLAAMLGLSTVHVNHTLAALKRDGHLNAGAGLMTLPRARELARRVGFPPNAAWTEGPSSADLDRQRPGLVWATR